MWYQPPPPPPHHQTTDHHHPPPPPYQPQFNPNPNPNPFLHPQPQPPNNPNFFNNYSLHPHPHPPLPFHSPDLLHPSAPRHQLPPSPNFVRPIHDPVEFRPSWPHHDHHNNNHNHQFDSHRFVNTNDIRSFDRGRDEWERSTSFKGEGTSLRQEVGNFMMRHQVTSGMDGYTDRPPFRYDSDGGQFRPSPSPRQEVGDFNMIRPYTGRYGYDSVGGKLGSEYNSFVQRSVSPMDFQGDLVNREWGCKRQRYEDGLRSRHSEFERGREGYVARRAEGNIQVLEGKVQRKSALLRIVDSSGQNSYRGKKPKGSGNGSTSKASPFKVKYSSPAKFRVKKEGDNHSRENTPVHVLFKSNSLVPKQIATPSSPVDITNNNSAPRNRKLASLVVDDLNISSHDLNKIPKSLRISGDSSHKFSRHEPNEVPDCGAVDRILFDTCASPAGKVDRFDEVLSVDRCNFRVSKQSEKRQKRKFSEYRVPLCEKPIKELAGRVISFSPNKVMNCNDIRERCRILPSLFTEAGSLVVSVDDHNQNPSPQHIGAAATAFSVKQCGSKQSEKDESHLSSDCCRTETMTDIQVANVNEIGSSKHHQENCIQISPPKADLLCNTALDQVCPENSLEGHTPTIAIAEDNKHVQEIDISLTNTNKRKEIDPQYDSTDSIPVATSHENDLFGKLTVDSDIYDCASPNPVGMEKEVMCVNNNGLDHLDVYSRSMVLPKDVSDIPYPDQASSKSANGFEVGTSAMITDSDPNERSTIGFLEGDPNISTQFDQKSTDVAPEIDKERVDNSEARTNLGGHARQVNTLLSVNTDINSLKSNRATTGRLKFQKSYAFHAPFSATMSSAIPKIESSKLQQIKSRTWRRSDHDLIAPLSGKTSWSNSIPVHSHAMKIGMPQGTSYIRKGNSLVRNPSPVIMFPQKPQVLACPAPQPISPSIEDMKESSENKKYLVLGRNRFGSSDNLPTIQNNEAGQLLERTSSCSSDTYPSESPNLSPIMSMANSCSKKNSAPIGYPDSTGLVQPHDEMKLKETVGSQSMPMNSPETQIAENNGSCVSLNSKHDSSRVIYGSSSTLMAVQKSQNNPILSSDSYYKTRINQIIRTPLDSSQPQPLSNCNSKIEMINAQNMDTMTNTLRLRKGTMHKSSNSSLVWTLQGAQLISKSTQGNFQFKKSTSWKEMRNSKNSRASLMLRKLTLYRNQNALYKRSTYGLSLRKYKVLAIGGCSLKWSKSIERRSKKASEDATRAVVAAESIKRVQSLPQNAMFRERTKQQASRGRMFRIGSVRYRMDPSRKTLRRVIDNASALDLEDKDSIRAYVPSRLAIGKTEYIRIGNGNQLVRDPKKRVRMLANEKIRWSLHNVRQRSIKKRRFCQFYTKFGKCNKDDGKCPYIHDTSKIAVCTKFLKGICSDPNCKLTHKIIPERMEDCSYFLQGMCSNESCPYRHVNVNPSAATCKGFLRGYCADGDECRKKHSYVCHAYEETGSCPEGSKCRFHHPKKQMAKQTGTRLQNFSKGRYFGQPVPEISDVLPDIPLKPQSTSSSDIFKDGDIPEFISLVDDDDAEIIASEYGRFSSKNDENDVDIEVFDINSLIKPIRIMEKDSGEINMGI